MSGDGPPAGEEAFTLVARDGVRLAVAAHVAARPGPALFIVHGIASHMGWYRGLARSLAAAGISTYLADRRGAGISEGARGHMASWFGVVDDLLHVAREVKRREPEKPLHLLGISLGGPFAMSACLFAPDLFSSLVLMAPDLASRIHVSLRRRVQIFTRALLRSGKLLALPITERDLTDRADWQKAIEQDPLRTASVSGRFIVELLRMRRYLTRSQRNYRHPVFAMLAENDTLINNDGVIAFLEGTSAPRIRIEIFEGAAHTLAACVPRDELTARIVAWLANDAADPRARVRTPAWPSGTAGLFEPP